MPQHPFPDPGPGGEEPDSSPLPSAAEEDGPEGDGPEGDWPEGDWEDWGGPAEQGLYMCLPAEQLTLAGFAAIAEYAARHAGSRPADEFAAVELAYELYLTPQSAVEQMHYCSSTVAQRLPRGACDHVRAETGYRPSKR